MIQTMTLTIPAKFIAGQQIVLTTEHSASSYGVPVAIVGGRAYGPSDVLPALQPDPLPWLREAASVTVRSAAHQAGLEHHPLVIAFR